jgi:hypothetical protein
VAQVAIMEGGTPGRNRTCDLPLRRRLLYPLSYWGIIEFFRTWRFLSLFIHTGINQGNRSSMPVATGSSLIIICRQKGGRQEQ